MASPSSSAADSLVHVAFNSNATHFVAATASGVRVFSCSPFKPVFSKDFPSPDGSGSAREVVSADVVGSGLLVAVVFREPSAGSSGAQSDKIRYWSELRHEMMPEDTNPPCWGRVVRAVRHVGSHVLVAGEEEVALHETSKKGTKRTVEVDTGPNPLGVCALAQARDSKEFVLACPRPAKGEVQVRRGSAGRVHVAAHSSSVVCVALSRDGTLLATAGSKGTVLRVFRTDDGRKIQELRRGADRADIYSMAFSPDSKWLAVSSDKGTIHVFSVNVDLSSSDLKDSHDPNNLHEGPAARANAKEQDANRGSYRSLLSGFVPKYFKQDGSLAKFRLREGEKYLVAFSHEPNTVLIIGMDGSFYRCKFDPVSAGEMKQVEYMNFMKTKRRC